MKRAATLYPRATAFIKGCDQKGLIDWLTNYRIGREALKKLESKLKKGRLKNGCFEIKYDD